MKISEKTIADYLKKFIVDIRLDVEKQFEFCGIRLINKMNVPLRQDILYVCDEASEMNGRAREPAEVCKLIKESEYNACGGISNSIILRDDVSLTWVFDNILGVFEKVNEFKESLQSAILCGSDIDDILSLAVHNLPEVLIVVTDAAYNIVHSTKSDVGDIYLDELLHRGYYNKDDIDKIVEKGYFEDWQRTIKPMRYSQDETVSGKSLLLRSYQSRGVLLGFIAGYFIDTQPDEVDCLIFKIITDGLEQMMLNPSNNGIFETAEERMLADMLNKDNADDARLLYDRAVRLGLPQNMNYRIGLIDSEQGMVSTAISITKYLRSFCPIKTYGIFKYKSMVLLVFYDWNYYSIKEYSELDDRMKQMVNILNASRCRIGISLGFDKIDSFLVAYMQACGALSGANAIPEQDPAPILFYSEYYLQDMLSAYSHEMPLDALYVKQLNALMPGKHGEYDNLKFLYVYLRMERNVAATARVLNMHRNGAIYRVNRITELLGLDLDDDDTRLRIMISFEVLKRTGKFKVDFKRPGNTEQGLCFKIKKD